MKIKNHFKNSDGFFDGFTYSTEMKNLILTCLNVGYTYGYNDQQDKVKHYQSRCHSLSSSLSMYKSKCFNLKAELEAFKNYELMNELYVNKHKIYEYDDMRERTQKIIRKYKYRKE